MDPQNITLISNRGNSPVLTQGGAHMPCRLIPKPKHTVRGNTMQHIRLFFFFLQVCGLFHFTDYIPHESE